MADVPTLSAAAARTARKVGGAFQRSIERMVRDTTETLVPAGVTHEIIEVAPVRTGSICQKSVVGVPMPKCKPPRPPSGGPIEMAPTSHAESRIVPPPYNRESVSPCGVCGIAKDIGTLCQVKGCPWANERDTVFCRPAGYGLGPLDRAVFHPAPAPTSAAMLVQPSQVVVVRDGFGKTGRDYRRESDAGQDRPLTDHAPLPLPPFPGADVPPIHCAATTPVPVPPPFDPVRAWIDVARAWTRCASVFAEMPLQIALVHRVAVGL